MLRFLFIIGFLFSANAISATPFEPAVDRRLGALDVATGEGTPALRYARFVYNTAVDGGTIGARGLGVFLPANAMIVRSYLYVKTQFVDGGAGTVALSCEDANNIKTATDITGSAAGALIEGQSTGAASAFTTGIAARCEITATVATADQTAGYLVGYVEYVVVE